ncbi:hypothetical protein [Streptomyces acidiscabies]|uniref:DUF222 domain-containing protein n=1 Tax=Streptomyces acidiscabies TaxID=42234 RepID=A0ABU4LWE0_9ACTN|nr:hypothetical protein [Streptomyces acidiscabies]MDX3020035.1 hypothetical protein [Streptomyces acidiscabies]
MTTTLAEWRAHARAAQETNRQVRRLYRLAYRIAPIGRILTNPNATADDITYATTRIPRVSAAVARLLTRPGVANHPETPYALSFLTTAEHALTAPSTQLLKTANTARAAAAAAVAINDDLRYVLFSDIEDRCRNLVDAAHSGWTRHEHATGKAVLDLAARWGLSPDARIRQPADDDQPPVPAYITQEVARRAEIRARSAAGIRCARTTCLAYGAVWTHDGTGQGPFLGSGCIPTVNAERAARGFAPALRAVPGGVPADARYSVTLCNGSGLGLRTVTCMTPQEAQFTAETVRPSTTWKAAHPKVFPA